MTNRQLAMEFSVAMVRAVCRLAGPFGFVETLRADLGRAGVLAAVRQHDNAKLFDWLMAWISFQGIADRVADQYIREHGNATWSAIKADLALRADCPRLGGYWLFEGCGYQKSHRMCSEPQHFAACSLP